MLAFRFLPQAFAFVLLSSWASATQAQTANPSPGHERVLLELAGAGVGIVSGVATGAAVGGAAAVFATFDDSSRAGLAGFYVGVLAALIQTAMAVPGAVWTLGRLSGRDGNIGYTLLGAFLGLAAGAAVWLGGYAADQADSADLATALYVSGGITAGVGLIAGSMIGYELSLDAESTTRVTVTPGSLRGDF